MKKSIIVNICGIVFHIDEDAYEALNSYLNALKNYFISQSGGREIVDDIEARIVELLQPKLSENKQSVTIEDIEEIISILGKPEDIAGSEDDSTNKQETAGKNNTDAKSSRRLYRDPENAIIGGVASGMAAYFNIDPVIFRLIFVALIFAGGAGTIIYLVLWISVPQAKTTSQRLEMKGENINVTNIEKKIREEYESVKTNISNISKSTPSTRLSGFIRELVLIFGKFVLMIVSVLKYIFAVFLIGLALMIIIGSIASVFFSNFAISSGFVSSVGSIQEFLNYILLPADTAILLFLSLLIILIPCSGLIYWGLKILIHFQAKDKWISTAMSILWILCIVVFITIALTEVNRFKSESKNSEVIALKQPSKNILYIQLQNTAGKITEFSSEDFNDNFFGVEINNNKKEIFAPIKIEFENASGLNSEIEIIRKVYCSNYQEATEALKSIKLEYSQNDTVILINPFFRFSGVQLWKFQYIKMIIRVPENVYIRFDKNSKPFINESNFSDYPDNHAWHNTWKVTSNGLELKN